MRLIRLAAFAAAFALLATPLTGCESDDTTDDGNVTADVGTTDPDGITSIGDAGSGDEDTGADTTVESDSAATDGAVGPDGGEPEPDRSISPLAKIAACQDVCEQAMEECADEIPFPDVETCQEACEADLATDPTYWTNWACAGDSCDAALCGFGDNGIETSLDAHPACIEACGLIDACNAYEALELPPGELGLCISSCTASSIVEEANPDPDGPDFESVVTCVADALSDACDEDAARGCIGTPDMPGTGSAEHLAWCAERCSSEGGLAELQEQCDANTPLVMAYGSGEQCIEDCTSKTMGQSFMWWGCVATVSCQDPVKCEDLPEESSAPCDGACGALFEACPDGGADMTDETGCRYLCTGYEMNFGPFQDDAGACMLSAAENSDQEQFCAPEGEAGAAMGSCLIEPSEQCADLCEVIAPCLEEDGEDLDIDECAFSCTVGGFGDTDAVAACVAGTDGTCEEAMMCLGGGGPFIDPENMDASDVCTLACSILDGDPDDPESEACAPDSPAKTEMPDFLKCMEGCTMTNDVGQAFAALGCLAVSDCGNAKGTVAHCIDFPIAVVPSCPSACAAAGVACDAPDVPGGPYCPELCSGSVSNWQSLATEEEVSACMDGLESCDGDGFGEILMCHWDVPSHCGDTCGSLTTCGMNDDGGCMDGCMFGVLGVEESDPFPACVAAAGDDCDAMAACWDQVFPPDDGP